MALRNSFFAVGFLFALVWSGGVTTVTSQTSCPLLVPAPEFSPSVNITEPILGSEILSQLEDIIQSYVTTGLIPQYGVAVVVGNETIFSSGLASTPFHIGSITKTFTALGALILRDQGRLTLDDPLTRFLPEFSIINPYTPHNITLREVMGHTSGLPRDLCFQYYVQAQTEEQCPVVESDVLKRISQMQLARPPWSAVPIYSSLGIALLGRAWEKATSPRKSWEDFMQEDILNPLGMKDSGVNASNVILAGRNATDPVLDTGWVRPAATMYSTALDLAKYLTFILNAEPPLISDASIGEWIRSSVAFPDGEGAYALPWELTKINSTRDYLVTKSGALAEYQGFVAIHPSSQLGISVLATGLGTAEGNAYELTQIIANYLIPAIEDSNARSIYARYAGLYTCASADNSSVLAEGSTVNVSFSPSRGLYADLNVSAVVNGTLQPFIPQNEVGLLLRNASEDSFWFARAPSCAAFTSLVTNATPLYPGEPWYYEISFDLNAGTLTLFQKTVTCTRAPGPGRG